MRKSIHWCGALLGLLALSGAAWADPPGSMAKHGGMMSGMGHGMMGDDMGDEHFERISSPHAMAALNFSDEQRKKIMELRRELRNNTWDLRRHLIDQREQLGMLYSADNFDVAAIKSAYDKLFQLKLKMIEHTLQFKQDLRKILTADQQKQLRQMMMGPMHGKKHGQSGQMDGDK